jgi:hypothetical protein
MCTETVLFLIAWQQPALQVLSSAGAARLSSDDGLPQANTAALEIRGAPAGGPPVVKIYVQVQVRGHRDKGSSASGLSD